MSNHVIGIDEVGWGCSAGPIVVCAAEVPFEHWDLLREWGFRDSKVVGNKRTRYSFGKCELLSNKLQEDTNGLATWAIAQAEPILIDKDGPGPTKEKLFWRALLILLNKNNWSPDNIEVVVDGNRKVASFPSNIMQEAIPKADDTILPVSVASVLAKAYRDKQMLEFHEQFPKYGFDAHKGYPTPAHLEAVLKYGPVKGLHRMHYLKTQVLNYYSRIPKSRRPALPKWATEEGWFIT